MAQEQSHQFDHSLVDEHKYNNLQHPADCGRFVCMLQEYVKHLKSLRAVNRLEQETAERSVNMLDNDIAWSIAVHSVDEFQEYDGSVSYCRHPLQSTDLDHPQATVRFGTPQLGTRTTATSKTKTCCDTSHRV